MFVQTAASLEELIVRDDERYDGERSEGGMGDA